MHLLQRLKWWASSPVYNCKLLRICQNISLTLQDSCNGLLVLFNCRYFSYVPCKMDKVLLRGCTIFVYLCYLSYMSWIKTQRKFNKMKSAFACIFHRYWLFLLVPRLDRGPANLPWEGECGLQAQSRERRRGNPLSHRQCGTACPI